MASINKDLIVADMSGGGGGRGNPLSKTKMNAFLLKPLKIQSKVNSVMHPKLVGKKHLFFVKVSPQTGF